MSFGYILKDFSNPYNTGHGKEIDIIFVFHSLERRRVTPEKAVVINISKQSKQKSKGSVQMESIYQCGVTFYQQICTNGTLTSVSPLPREICLYFSTFGVISVWRFPSAGGNPHCILQSSFRHFYTTSCVGIPCVGLVGRFSYCPVPLRGLIFLSTLCDGGEINIMPTSPPWTSKASQEGRTEWCQKNRAPWRPDRHVVHALSLCASKAENVQRLAKKELRDVRVGRRWVS